MDKWLLILLCFCVSAASAEMYKWVDNDGKVYYTDQPPDAQAEELSLPPLNSYKAPELGGEQMSQETNDDLVSDEPLVPDQAPGEESAAAYAKLTITSPKMNETIRNDAGTVQVNYTLTPGGLKQGHTYRLMLDGRVIKGASTTLANVDRGSHTVKAQIVDATGAVQLSSQAVIFHLHREADGADTAGDNQPDDNSDAYTPSSDDADHSAEEDDGIGSGDGSDFDPTNITDPDDTRDSVYDPESPGYDSGSPSSGNYNPNSTPNYSPNYTPNYNQR